MLATQTPDPKGLRAYAMACRPAEARATRRARSRVWAHRRLTGTDHTSLPRGALSGKREQHGLAVGRERRRQGSSRTCQAIARSIVGELGRGPRSSASSTKSRLGVASAAAILPSRRRSWCRRATSWASGRQPIPQAAPIVRTSLPSMLPTAIRRPRARGRVSTDSSRRRAYRLATARMRTARVSLQTEAVDELGRQGGPFPGRDVEQIARMRLRAVDV